MAAPDIVFRLAVPLIRNPRMSGAPGTRPPANTFYGKRSGPIGNKPSMWANSHWGIPPRSLSGIVSGTMRTLPHERQFASMAAGLMTHLSLPLSTRYTFPLCSSLRSVSSIGTVRSCAVPPGGMTRTWDQSKPRLKRASLDWNPEHRSAEDDEYWRAVHFADQRAIRRRGWKIEKRDSIV